MNWHGICGWFYSHGEEYPLCQILKYYNVLYSYMLEMYILLQSTDSTIFAALTNWVDSCLNHDISMVF